MRNSFAYQESPPIKAGSHEAEREAFEKSNVMDGMLGWLGAFACSIVR